MSERFWIVLVVAVAVVVVVLILRRQLKSLILKGLGMEAEVQTHGGDSEPGDSHGGVRIKDFKMLGRRNRLDISRDDVVVERTKQKGVDQEIRVAEPQEPKKPEPKKK